MVITAQADGASAVASYYGPERTWIEPELLQFLLGSGFLTLG